MKKLLFISLFMYMPISLLAHNPQISTLVLVQNEHKQWNLIIGSSLTAFQYALQNKGLLNPSDTIQAARFQKLILDYLRENIQLSSNGDQRITLKNGMMILNHQTDVRYDLPEMPQQLQTLIIRQQSFASLKNHYCLLKISPYGGTSSSFILQPDNDFTISLQLEGNHLIEVPHQPNPYGTWLTVLAGGLALFGFWGCTQHKKRTLSVQSL
ncbi:hypothetical protein [Spirosoma foliorum]|uniref:Uncharacterized protein n=1 Tax=Spirosoma foliorum TaxID=2710596 RepID=A0A7G5H237_9BACT|nr:hypothetical protein [Spirosoma foliorum]QMW05179.1 hypothetical protein H3H32_09965 [Spirosoma foliorum]